MASIPNNEREALSQRLGRFLQKHYTSKQIERVRIGFRGANATLTVLDGTEEKKAGILRWTGNPEAWGFGKWEGSSYSHFWINGRRDTPPEWGLAMALHYCGINPPAVKENDLFPLSTMVERWAQGQLVPTPEEK